MGDPVDERVVEDGYLYVINDRELHRGSREFIIKEIRKERLHEGGRPAVLSYFLRRHIGRPLSQEEIEAIWDMVVRHHIDGGNLYDEIGVPRPSKTLEQLNKEIEEHRNNAAESFRSLADKLSPPKEEKQMDKKAPLYKVEHKIRGVLASDVSDDDLITTIKEVEKEIKDLGSIETPSKAIAKRIKELENGLKQIVKELDSRS